jgi:hypothetical protein
VVEKLVTLGKRGDPYARRIAISRLRDAALVQKLIDAHPFSMPLRAISWIPFKSPSRIISPPRP